MYDLTSGLKPPAKSNPDFDLFKREIGVTEDDLFHARARLRAPETTRAEMEISIGPSEIHGHGVFLDSPMALSESIAPIFVNGSFTLTGLMINHNLDSNCAIRESKNGDLWLSAKYFLDEGTELTINYREVG